MSQWTRLCGLLLIGVLPLCAHTVSMSTSRLEVQDSRASLELRVPEYEAKHVADPNRTLPQAIEIGGKPPARVQCSAQDGTYVCRSEYEIAADAPIEVKCVLAKVIVDNHVHVMHARRGGRLDQAVFDAYVQDAVLRFRQAGALESAIRSRPQLVAMVLLAALAAGVLGVGRKGLIAACGAFAVATLAAGLIRFASWQLTPGFLETAVAVAAAYAAFEALFMPPGKLRPFLAAALGLVLGSYLLSIVPADGAGHTLALAVAAAAIVVALIVNTVPFTRRLIAGFAMAVAIAWVGWSNVFQPR
jgi:hypothetical protein